jgi:hypothetical protein
LGLKNEAEQEDDSMLSAKKVKIVAAGNLSPGDVALLSVMDNNLAIVSLIGEKKFVVALERPKSTFDLFELSEAYGIAMVLQSVEFEIDPSSYSESALGFGCLVRYGTELLINARGRIGSQHLRIADGFDAAEGQKAYFGRWRAVIRDADAETVIFEYPANAEL